MSTGLIVLAVISKYIPVENAGLWFTMQASASFVVLAEMGSGYVLMREFSRRFGEYESSQKLKNHGIGTVDINTISTLRIITVSLSLLIGILFTVYFILTGKGELNIEVVGAWLIYVITSSINVALIPNKSYLESSGNLDREKYISSIGHGIGALLVILAAIYTESLLAISAGNGIGILVTFLLLRRECHKTWGAPIASNVLDMDVKRVLKIGFGFFWINIGVVATKYSYAPIVTGILGGAALAPLFIVTKVFSTVSTAITIFVTSERALIARFWGAKNTKLATNHFKKLLIIIGVLSISLGGVVAVTSAILIPDLLGDSYSLPYVLFIILFIDWFKY